MSSRKCFYEILGIAQDASDADIKKAYRTQALAHHPDKNPGRENEAAEAFKQVQHAYSVLSDPHERAWYDSHRTQILRGHDPSSKGDAPADAANATEVDLFACFTSAAFKGFDDAPDGFYAFYADVFERLWQEEVEVMTREGKTGIPSSAAFGGVGASWETVRDFYRFWESFASCKSFSFADVWNLAEAPNRDFRRHMEKENKKERAKVKKEFNSTVRELVAFVKKRDPRVAARRAHEEREREQKQKEATEKEKLRLQHRRENAAQTRAARDEALEEDAEGLDEILKNIALDEKIERKEKRKKARRRRGDVVESEDSDRDHAHESNPAGEESAHSHDLNDGGRSTYGPIEESAEGTEDSEQEDVEEELYCIACRKAFRTSAQQTDHERSKKHRAAVAKLKKQMLREEETFTSTQGNLEETVPRDASDEQSSGRDGAIEDEDLTHSGGGNGKISEAATKMSKSKKKRKKQKAQNATGNETPSMDVAVESNSDGFESAQASAKTGESLERQDDLEDSAAATPQADDDKSKEPQLTKKQKRRLREQKKKDQTGGSTDAGSQKCNVCGAAFASRNKLMRHIESTGHALYVPHQAARQKRH